MANLTHVDPAELRSTAKNLEEVEEEIARSVQKITEAMDLLDKGWVSTVKDQFLQVWRTDAEAMSEMMAQLSEVRETLLLAAETFERAEQESLSGVSRLR